MNLKELAHFLVKAKCNAYAGDGKEIPSQRPGFKELEFKEGPWEYRDSYVGYFMAPGQEYVRYNGQIVWAMAYTGGMVEEYREDKNLAKQTFQFLKQALQKIEVSRPFRGPNSLSLGDWEYRDKSEGDITDFKGVEHIFYKGKEVFKQNYIGGVVLSK
ncbi:MAG: DUF5680 domain-containing protein [bacterium]|nr:DUF5680 domain-containing protein [bacterium]